MIEEVTSTAEIKTGANIGNSNMGSITSLALVLTAIVENKVPTKDIAKMTSRETRAISTIETFKSYKTIIVGNKITSSKIINAIFDKTLPKKKASLLVGDSRILLIAPDSISIE